LSIGTTLIELYIIIFISAVLYVHLKVVSIKMYLNTEFITIVC